MIGGMDKKTKLKQDFKRLFRSMDFVADYLRNSRGKKKRIFEIHCDIYQQLGLAWEYWGNQCQHWEGYKKIKDGKLACRICGYIRQKATCFEG